MVFLNNSINKVTELALYYIERIALKCPQGRLGGCNESSLISNIVRICFPVTVLQSIEYVFPFINLQNWGLTVLI